MNSSVEDSPVVSKSARQRSRKPEVFDSSDSNSSDLVDESSDDDSKKERDSFEIPETDSERSESEVSEIGNSELVESKCENSELVNSKDGSYDDVDSELENAELGEMVPKTSRALIDSDAEDQEGAQPEDQEESDESVIEDSPAPSLKTAVSSNTLLKSITRKSLGSHFKDVNESPDSVYLSFGDTGTPLKADAIHHSSPISSKKTTHSPKTSGHNMLNEISRGNLSADFSANGNNSQENLSAEVSDIEHDSSQANNSEIYASADASGSSERREKSPNISNEKLNGHGTGPSAVSTNDSNLSLADTNLAGEINFNKESNIESASSEDENGVQILSPSTPKRSSLVDLTQSDSSLQNSPVGATRQQLKRDIADIVSELSSTNNDIMVKQALLDSINISTLPDNGRNLMQKVAELKKRKSELEDELHSNEEYTAQQTELEQMRSRLKVSATKQTTLNFQSMKSEPNETFRTLSYEKKDMKSETNLGDDFSPEEKPSALQIPNWGDLPQPNMTISGFGKKAMQTHLAEKALTMEALSSLHQALKSCPTEETEAQDPKYLKVELLPHQKHGLAWMLWREQEKPSGGILADDMGLGKTISMISLILKSQELKEEAENDSSDSDSESSPVWLSKKHSRMPKGGTLVVCPASLMNQWEREILKRVKKRALSVELYHGPKRETKPRRLAKYDVIITTYNLVSRESGVETAKNATVVKEQGPLFLINWNRIILDEAHMVRNHKSQMALGVCELTAKHRWCLTGTPIQNKELDLYALLKFLRCSPFDDLTVWKRWVDNKNAAGMQRLNTMMKSLMLRRTKEQLQAKGDLDCLPVKYYERVDIHLDPEELVIYEKVAIFSNTLFAQFLNQRAEKQQILDARYGISSKPVWEQEAGPDNQFVTTEELAKMHRKMKGIQDIKTHQILVLLLRLRQVCNHPGLIKKMVEDGDLDIGGVGGVEDNSGLDVDLFNQMNNLNIEDSNIEESEKEDLNKSAAFTADNPVLEFERPSAKIRAVLDLIQEKVADTDDKAIIVSQWTSMLNIIAPFLKQMKIKFECLTGEVPVDKRQNIVNDFNKENAGPQILLLSLTAGGVGLNLVGANHLLLVDIHWNPQLENQACDRIYRVGQKKDVFIYRFITINTIEERIKSLQDHKLAIAESVLTGTKNTQASKLTLDDLKMLFSVPAPHEPVDIDNNLPHNNV